MFRLFLLYAILIFAKRAPKLIAELLKLKGDNIGLKGLNIKNKMGEAALVGDKVKKGMMAAEGGIKKAAGASKQLLKDALINTNNGVAGAIGGDIKGGWKDGWNDSEKKGKGFFGKLSGAVKGSAEKGKESIWDKRSDNWKNFKGDVKTKLVDNAGENVKKVVGNLAQGANEYRNKENTKGASLAGRRNINVNFRTVGEGFERLADNATRGISKWAGLDDDKAAKSRYDRSLLGFNADGENGGKKIKIDKEFMDRFPGVVKSNLDGTFTINGDITSKLQELNIPGNIIKQNEDGSYSYDSDSLREYKKSNEYENLDETTKKAFDREGLAGILKDIVTSNSDNTYCINAKGLEAFKDGEEYKSWNREKQLTFDKYTDNQTRDDLNTLKACFDQISQLTSAISSAKNANTASGLVPGQQGYISTDALEKQLELLNKRVLDIGEQHYTYNKKPVDISNIDSAITKINEDLSKNSSDLAALKESQKPKENKN